MKRIAPFGGGDASSAASKARMSFSHFALGDDRRGLRGCAVRPCLGLRGRGQLAHAEQRERHGPGRFVSRRDGDDRTASLRPPRKFTRIGMVLPDE